MKVALNEDNILVQNIQDGNKAGFQSLYELMFSPLCGFGQKYLVNNLLIEDFVQEAFISLWKKHKDFQDLTPIKSYLYTSVKNSCLNYIKHQDVKRKNEAGVVQQIESENYYKTAVIEEETFSLLFQEIKNLPESSQKIMLLALNGLRNPEIAEELGISINTIKTLKRNAYSRIREKLSPAMQQSLYNFLF